MHSYDARNNVKREKVTFKVVGADIVLTPGAKGMGGAIAKATQLMEEHGDKAYMPTI